MEDALALKTIQCTKALRRVLILVLMEDALAPVVTKIGENKVVYPCLNPCFNGRCTRTHNLRTTKYRVCCVLILVLMEDALAQTKDTLITLSFSVLILVLMEDALARIMGLSSLQGFETS